MAENFEIVASTKCLFSQRDLIDFSKEINVKIDSIKVIDNWDYENERVIHFNDISLVNDLIVKNKIVIFECHSGIVNCGAFISKISNSEYEYSLWFSLKNLIELATDKITPENRYIYNRIVEYIKRYRKDDTMNFCAMGVEIYIADLADFEEKIKRSNGVVRWILPEKNSLRSKRFIEETDDNLYLYSIYA